MPLTVEGALELRDKFNRLREEVRREVLEEAALRGAEPIVETAKALAPVMTKLDPRRIPGTIRDTIVARLRPRKAPDRVTVIIGPRKRGKLDPYFAKFVEFGHLIGLKKSERVLLRLTRAQARTRQKALGRFVPAQPFMRPALLARGQEAGEIVRRVLWTGIQRIWGR